MKTEDKVLAILLVQFNLSPIPAIKAIDTWLKANTQENLHTFTKLLEQKEIALMNGQLKTKNQNKIASLTNPARENRRHQSIAHSQLPSVKVLRFRGVTYRKLESPPIPPNPTLANDDIPLSTPQVVNFHEYAERKTRSSENQGNQTEYSGA